MKKTIFTVSFLLIFSTLVLAQRHQIGVGASYHSFKVEDATAVGYYGSYVRPFGESTFIGLSAEMANPNGQDSLMMKEKQLTVSGSLQFMAAVFKNDYHRLMLGGGLTGRYFSEKWLLDDNLQLQQAAFKPGLELLGDYSFFITEFSWVIGSRIRYQVYEKGNSVLSIGGHLAYRF
jgi:hypothetical protein